MKEMNRREFLTLTGAAVVALSLAGCGAPSAPAAPTGKEADLLAAINKVWKEKHALGLVDYEQLTLNQEAQGAIKIQGEIFENAQKPAHTPTIDDRKKLVEITVWEQTMRQKYDLGGAAGVSEPSSEPSNEGEISLTFEYSCDNTVVQQFVDKIMEYLLRST